MMTGLRERLGAEADEWQVIEPRLQAVLDAQRTSRELQGMGMRMGMRDGAGAAGREAPEPVAAVEKAIEGGDAAVIKTAVDALRQARAEREAGLTTAKNALREVLSVTQEAQLVLMGLLD